ncbi:MAG: DnaJ domain-containing protein [Phycisphaerales bacterium JB038]
MALPWSKSNSRRGQPRYRTTALACDLGEVLDLSTPGLRLRCDSSHACQQGALLTLTLQPGDGSGQLRLTGHAVWVKRSGLRHREIGVSFINVRPSTAASLQTLAATGSLRDAPQVDDATAQGAGWQADFTPEPTAEEEHREALGVSAQATFAEIQAAYLQLARRYHPDQSGDADTQADFIRITRAYEALKATLNTRASQQRRAS